MTRKVVLLNDNKHFLSTTWRGVLLNSYLLIVGLPSIGIKFHKSQGVLSVRFTAVNPVPATLLDKY